MFDGRESSCVSVTCSRVRVRSMNRSGQVGSGESERRRARLELGLRRASAGALSRVGARRLRGVTRQALEGLRDQEAYKGVICQCLCSNCVCS